MNINAAMELEELENLSKSDFLPLIPLIKQEQLDSNLQDGVQQEQQLPTADNLAASTSSSSSSSIGNPCDSAEKRVSEIFHFMLSRRQRVESLLSECV